MSILPLRGYKLSVVPEVDLRKRYNSLASYLLSKNGCFINVDAEQDLVICFNHRFTRLRFLMRSGDQQIEGNCKFDKDHKPPNQPLTYKHLVDKPESSCYQPNAEYKALIKEQLEWLELNQVDIVLILDSVDMRKRYDSLSDFVLAKYHINVGSGKVWVVCFNGGEQLLRLIGKHGSMLVELTSTLTEGTRHALIEKYRQTAGGKLRRSLSLRQLKRLLAGQAG